MFWPCETRTSTCRNFATISSGLYRFLVITVLLDVKDIPQVGPLQWGRIKGAMFQPERTHNERIYLSVSWQRPDGAIPRGNAEIHAEMARLVQGVGRKGPHQIPWTSARARRQGRQGEAEERPRWALCRGQGHRQRLHSDRGEGPSSRGRTLQGLSDLGGGRVRRSTPHPRRLPGCVMEP